jgi:hypothetical protein
MLCNNQKRTPQYSLSLPYAVMKGRGGGHWQYTGGLRMSSMVYGHVSFGAKWNGHAQCYSVTSAGHRGESRELECRHFPSAVKIGPLFLNKFC